LIYAKRNSLLTSFLSRDYFLSSYYF